LRVILPQQNAKDLRELPDEVRREMQFILASRIEDALAAAIPALAVRLGDSANVRIADSPSDGREGQAEPRAAKSAGKAPARRDEGRK
jgi:hypothetical protein